MKWIDTTLFNGEPVIKLRLELLYLHVDRFYITEQRHTHQGQKKDNLYIEKYRDWFLPYMDKISFLVDENDYSQEKDPWVIENSQRNYSLPYILDNYKGKQYICSVCDCDEIPDCSVVLQKENLYNSCTNGAVVMNQKLFYYNLNWKVCDWKRAFFVNDKLLERIMDFQIFRNEKGPVSEYIDCGWHLSYFMEPADILRKIESFAHNEYNYDKYKKMDHLKNCIMNGHDLYYRGEILSKNTNMDFPKEILDFHTNLFAAQRLGLE